METRPHSRAWALAFGVVAIVLIVTLAMVFVFHSIRSLPGDAVRGGLEVAGRLGQLASAFQEGTVTTTFSSYAVSLSGSNYLQVASLRQMEVFTREDRGTVLWGGLELPDVVVAATAPVEYTYYLDLEQRWDFALEENILLVSAPALEFNEPSIDVSGLHFEVRSSSLLRDEEEVVRQLREGLMQYSRKRAHGHIDLVRETARSRVREFLRTWLTGSFSDASQYRIDIFFEDERPRLDEPVALD